jgi:dienelactone hydrolase
MTLRSESLEYSDGGTICEGYVAYDASGGAKRPCVLIAHAWDGPNEYIRAKALELAGMGYLGFALDVYGKGVRGGVHDDNSPLMAPFMNDRALLRRRLDAAFTAAKQHPLTDPARMAVIGYCFGGLCALDLARSVPPGLLAAVSFHGVLQPPRLGPQAAITARILILHGWRDALVSEADVLAITRELSDAGADWQLTVYGRAMHAFTNPAIDAPRDGIAYDAAADRHSWAAMSAFLEESLGSTDHRPARPPSNRRTGSPGATPLR